MLLAYSDLCRQQGVVSVSEPRRWRPLPPSLAFQSPLSPNRIPPFYTEVGAPVHLAHRFGVLWFCLLPATRGLPWYSYDPPELPTRKVHLGSSALLHF